MRLALSFILLLTGCTLLSGCGQKGPLFIPSDDQPSQLQPAAPAAAPRR
jgi:predicted small lipoprotein YifL